MQTFDCDPRPLERIRTGVFARLPRAIDNDNSTMTALNEAAYAYALFLL